MSTSLDSTSTTPLTRRAPEPSERLEGVITARAEETLVPDSPSVGQARGLVHELCHDAGVDPDTCDTAVLLTSETVTNAIIHGRSEVRVSAEVTDGWIHVAVGDDNSRHPRLQSQDSEALDGRGLQILELAASRWGVVEDVIGKVVWFQVDREPTAVAS